MPRPVGPWVVPEDRERDIFHAIRRGKIDSLTAYATEALSGGYSASDAISGSEKALLAAQSNLADFQALPNQDVAAINNAEHAERVDAFTARKSKSEGERGRLQAVLTEAQEFVPPSAEHHDFADYLVERLQAEVAAINIPPSPPAAVPLPQFRARQISRLESAVAAAQERVDQETAADIQWVKDLRDAL